MEKLKLIQCYHCWEIASHIKTECPKFKHNEPQLCPRCGVPGHKSTECVNNPYCINCKGPHPATARICTIYKQKFAETMTEISTEMREALNLQNIPLTPQSTTVTSNTDAWQALYTAFISSHSPDGFLLTLYDIMKVTTPRKTYAPPTLAYNCDLDMSEASLCSSLKSQSQTEQLPPQYPSEQPEQPTTQHTEQSLLQSEHPTLQHPIPEQPTSQHQANTHPLPLEHTAQHPTPEQLISSTNGKILRKCSLMESGRIWKASIHIKLKETGDELVMHNLDKDTPHEIVIRFRDIENLKIDPSNTHHLRITERYDPHQRPYYYRIKMYSNGPDTSPDPRAAYETLKYLKKRLLLPQNE